MQKIYPSTGNFVAVVGNKNSADPVASIKQALQKNTAVDCRSLIAPPSLQGMDFSDPVADSRASATPQTFAPNKGA